MEPDEIVRQLVEAPGNNQCFDCEKTPVQWVSVNNGVFLCAECASKHRELGPSISEVVPIYESGWTHDDIAMLQAGGNQSLRDFFSEYEFEDCCKYMTRAADYYRKVLTLKASILKIEKPSPVEGCEVIKEHRISDVFESVYKKSKRITNRIQSDVTNASQYKKLEERTSDLWEKTKNAMDPHFNKIESQTSEIWGKTKEMIDPSIAKTTEMWGKTKEMIDPSIAKTTEMWGKTKGIIDPQIAKTTEILGKTKDIIEPQIARTSEIFEKTKEFMDPTINKIEQGTTGVWTKTKEYLEQIKQSERYQCIQEKVKDSINKMIK